MQDLDLGSMAAPQQHVDSDDVAPTRQRTTVCLPGTLVRTIPQCAIDCVARFVLNNYNNDDCSSLLNLDFICSLQTTSGLTLGEGALACVASDCTATHAEESAALNICSGQPGAIVGTLRTITATISAAPQPSWSVTGTGGSTYSRSSFALTTLTVTPPSTFASYPAPTSTSAAFPTAQTAGDSPSDPVSQPSPQTLTRGQIAGIAVSGGAAAVFGLFLVLYMIILRRRRLRNAGGETSSILGEKAAARFSFGPRDDGNTQANLGSVPLPVPVPPRFYPPSQQQVRNTPTPDLRPKEIGVAISPDRVEPSPPESATSQRTTSKLLPALPEKSLWPKPLRLSAQPPPRDNNRLSTGTLIEEAAVTEADSRRAVLGKAGRPQQMVETKYGKQPRALPTIDTGYNRTAGQEKPTARPSFVSKPSSTSILTTPVYDNGNIETALAAKQRAATGFGLNAASAATASRADNTNLNRPYVRAQYQPVVQQDVPVGPYETQRIRRPSAQRSEPSQSTIIDEDSTPEQELDRQLGNRRAPARLNVTLPPSEELPEESSPIRNLTYPPMPRPAAVSRQAEYAAQPRQLRRTNMKYAPLRPPPAFYRGPPPGPAPNFRQPDPPFNPARDGDPYSSSSLRLPTDFYDHRYPRPGLTTTNDNNNAMRVESRSDPRLVPQKAAQYLPFPRQMNEYAPQAARRQRDSDITARSYQQYEVPNWRRSQQQLEPKSQRRLQEQQMRQEQQQQQQAPRRAPAPPRRNDHDDDYFSQPVSGPQQTKRPGGVGSRALDNTVTAPVTPPFRSAASYANATATTGAAGGGTTMGDSPLKLTPKLSRAGELYLTVDTA